MRPLLAVASLALLAGTLLSACADVGGTANPRSAELPPTPTAEPPPAPASPGATLTYVDPTFGYSFEYPSTWFISPDGGIGGYSAVYSYDLTAVPPEKAGMPVPPDELKVEIIVLDNPQNLSLEGWIEEDRSRGAPVQVVSQSQVVIDGVQGISQVVELAEGAALQNFFMKGGKVYVVSAYPAGSLLADDFAIVVGSFRFNR